MITDPQRDVLISHIDGPCAVVLPMGGRAAYGETAASISRRWVTTSRLLACGFLRGDPGGAARPVRTVMTLAGREALAQALAAMAEILVAAGYGLEPPQGWSPEFKPPLTLPPYPFRRRHSERRAPEDMPCEPPAP